MDKLAKEPRNKYSLNLFLFCTVKVTNITSSMVKVWWKIILYSNVSFDNVNGYKVSLTNQLNERYEINVGRNSKSVTISKNVSVNTSYTCKVIGLLDNGDRLVSGRFHFKTLGKWNKLFLNLSYSSPVLELASVTLHK